MDANDAVNNKETLGLTMVVLRKNVASDKRGYREEKWIAEDENCY